MMRTFHREASLIGLGFVALILLGCFLAWTCSGCCITLSDNGSVSIEFTQGIKISHETSTTGAESKATTDLRPLMDWIIKLRGEEPMEQTAPLAP